MANKIIKPLNKKNRRAWQRMLSGRKLDILSPSPFDIEIEDIALGLSRVTRWNGQTTGKYPYSVAQHSLLVEELFNIEYPDLDKKWNLAALLHDAHLSILGPGGERQVAMQEWPLAYMMPSIAEDEILTAVTISPWDTPSGHAYEEFARRHGDFAIVGVGALLSVDNGSITRAAIAIAGAIAGAPAVAG